MYPIVKQIHVILVVISITLFQFRYWRFQVLQHRKPKWLVMAPHVIDTLLLISGISLAVMIHISPLSANWLLYKLLLLIVYVGFGTMAMKSMAGRQWLSYVVATLAVAYMVFLAVFKTTWLVS